MISREDEERAEKDAEENGTSKYEELAKEHLASDIVDKFLDPYDSEPDPELDDFMRQRDLSDEIDEEGNCVDS